MSAFHEAQMLREQAAAAEEDGRIAAAELRLRADTIEYQAFQGATRVCSRLHPEHVGTLVELKPPEDGVVLVRWPGQDAVAAYRYGALRPADETGEAT